MLVVFAFFHHQRLNNLERMHLFAVLLSCVHWSFEMMEHQYKKKIFFSPYVQHDHLILFLWEKAKTVTKCQYMAKVSRSLKFSHFSDLYRLFVFLYFFLYRFWKKGKILNMIMGYFMESGFKCVELFFNFFMENFSFHLVQSLYRIINKWNE